MASEPLPAHPPTLLTSRLALEPLREEHAARLFPILWDPELYEFIPTNPPDAPAVLEARYRRLRRGPPDAAERWWNWALVLRNDRLVALGTLEVTVRDWGRDALLAYTLGRGFWHLGFAGEAILAALDYLKTVDGLQRIRAEIDTRNARSLALVERCGFVRQETVANADYFKGATSDEHHYLLWLGKEDRGKAQDR